MMKTTDVAAGRHRRFTRQSGSDVVAVDWRNLRRRKVQVEPSVASAVERDMCSRRWHCISCSSRGRNPVQLDRSNITGRKYQRNQFHVERYCITVVLWNERHYTSHHWQCHVCPAARGVSHAHAVRFTYTAVNRHCLVIQDDHRQKDEVVVQSLYMWKPQFMIACLRSASASSRMSARNRLDRRKLMQELQFESSIKRGEMLNVLNARTKSNETGSFK